MISYALFLVLLGVFSDQLQDFPGIRLACGFMATLMLG